MKARLLLDERHALAEEAFVELVIWQVPRPVFGSQHGVKYRLALVIRGECVLRYDNEAGKGDHKHLNGEEIPYDYSSAELLLQDFWQDVDRWRLIR